MPHSPKRGGRMFSLVAKNDKFFFKEKVKAFIPMTSLHLFFVTVYCYLSLSSPRYLPRALFA